MTIATLLTGVPLNNREIDFTVTGTIDGTSAGALMTVAVIALMRGDQLAPDVTMTGAINPDGGIGPVSDVPAKLAGRGAGAQDALRDSRGRARHR